MEVTKGPARKLIPAREWLDKNEIRALTDAGVIVTDERRRRPLYFDGRFLAARDLTRDQNYFLTRQADLGQVGGAGVVHGLMVQLAGGSAIAVQAGHGVTTSGELVVIPRTIPRLDLTNIPEMQRLNAAFGLSQIPNEPARTRSGLFILALRPVEFTANPIASYPTSIDGPRSVEDGDVIEAVAITLIPFPDEGARAEGGPRRARMARQIFVEGGARGVPAGVLPLAMIALDRGVVSWVDPFMVRREVGAEHGNIVGLGFAPRALREAHLLQYEFQLREVIRERAVRGLRFAATEHFLALPAVGQMPAAAIDVDNFTQIFFPAAVRVDLSIVPEDEMQALITEGLRLPPIDLTLDEEQLASTAVLALVPVPRSEYQRLLGKLSTIPRRLAPAAPDMIAKRPPVEALRLLRMPFAAEEVAGDLADDAWRSALSRSPLLWFVRRANLSYKADLAGSRVELAGKEEKDNETEVDTILDSKGLLAEIRTLREKATARGRADLADFLSARALQNSDTLLRGAIRQLKKEGEKGLDSATVRRVATNFADERLLEDIDLVEGDDPRIKADPKEIEKLLDTGKLGEFINKAKVSLREKSLEPGRESTGGTLTPKKDVKLGGTVKEAIEATETRDATGGFTRADAGVVTPTPKTTKRAPRATKKAATGGGAPAAATKRAAKRSSAKKAAARKNTKKPPGK